MFKTAMKSTSVLALCTALTTPASFAQDSTEGLAECTVVGPFPCVTTEGVRVENALELAKETVLPSDPAEEETATTPEPPATPQTPATPEPPATPDETADETPDEATQSDAQAQGEGAAAEVEAEAEADVEAEVESPEPDTPETAEQTPAPDENPDEAPEAAEATDGDVNEADEKSLAESLAEEIAEEVAPEDPATDPAPEETQADADAEAPAEDPAQETAEESEEAPGDAPAGDAASDEPAQDPAQDKAEAPAGEPAPDATPAQDESQQATTDEAAPSDAAPKEMPSAEVQAEAEAAATQSAAAQDAASEDDLLDDTAGEGEGVETVQVTEESARSSGEAFATDVNTGPQAKGEAQSGKPSGNLFDRELTPFQKTLLVGLGGVAIGTILANGDEIIGNSGDRIVLRAPDGSLEVLKDDDEILRQPGSEVRTRTYEDGSTRTVVTRPDGVRIVTVRAANGTVLKRVRVLANGDRYVLFDDTRAAEPVDQAQLKTRQPARDTSASSADEKALREALLAAMNEDPGRRYSLRQVREFKLVRDLAPVIEVDAVTFATGSAVIEASQAEELAALGTAIRDVIREVPDAVFLIEGHTDAVGDAAYNLALSDRRAESVALALTEYFDVPPENLITQGYGESELKIATSEAERRNRRANVRNITSLLR